MQIINQSIIEQLYNNLNNLDFCYSLINGFAPDALSESGFNLPSIIACSNSLPLINYAHKTLKLDFGLADEFAYTALHLAAKFNRIIACRYILENKLVDVNKTTHGGYTPLICAAFSAELNLIQLLITNGANPFILSRSGKTAIDYAHKNPHQEVIHSLQKLISQGQYHAEPK